MFLRSMVSRAIFSVLLMHIFTEANVLTLALDIPNMHSSVWAGGSTCPNYTK